MYSENVDGLKKEYSFQKGFSPMVSNLHLLITNRVLLSIEYDGLSADSGVGCKNFISY